MQEKDEYYPGGNCGQNDNVRNVLIGKNWLTDVYVRSLKKQQLTNVPLDTTNAAVINIPLLFYNPYFLLSHLNTVVCHTQSLLVA